MRPDSLVACRTRILSLRGSGGLEKLSYIIKSKQTRDFARAYATWKGRTKQILEIEKLDAMELERKQRQIGRVLHRFSWNVLGVSFGEWADKVS